MNKTSVQAELPEELVSAARVFAAEGWARDLNELLADALRRYLESHSSQLTETFLRQDVEWGLHGQDYWYKLYFPLATIREW